jgi:hypothetical protein
MSHENDQGPTVRHPDLVADEVKEQTKAEAKAEAKAEVKPDVPKAPSTSTK